jgi:hypothetical protein
VNGLKSQRRGKQTSINYCDSLQRNRFRMKLSKFEAVETIITYLNFTDKSHLTVNVKYGKGIVQTTNKKVNTPEIGITKTRLRRCSFGVSKSKTCCKNLNFGSENYSGKHNSLVCRFESCQKHL